jgi:hypothetical protein
MGIGGGMVSAESQRKYVATYPNRRLIYWPNWRHLVYVALK